MKIFFLILFACLVADAQSPGELRQRYGEPTEEIYIEKYQVRPYNEKTNLSVYLTVTYTKSKEIRQMLVEVFPYFVGTIPPTNKKEDEIRTLLLREAVDEVFPPEKRGRNIINGFVSSTCSDDGCFGTTERYEKVNIFFNGNNHRYATINFNVAEPK